MRLRIRAPRWLIMQITMIELFVSSNENYQQGEIAFAPLIVRLNGDDTVADQA